LRTISFYSYKGGTGRTLLVANLATYAARLGRTVVMVDLDLEAPGLAYKFKPAPPNRPGVVEWLSAPQRPNVDDLAEPIEVLHPFNPGGALWLIGAGPPPSLNYLREVRRLQSTAFGDDSASAVSGMLSLRDAIAERFAPELLLLDARTGITNTNAITTRVLADVVVALTLHTPEQLDGTREVLRSLAALTKPGRPDEPLALHVAISRVTDPPNLNDADRRQRDADIVNQARQFLTEPADPLSATLTLTHPPLLLHNDVRLAANEHLLLAERTNEDPTRSLHFDYLRIAQTLLGDNMIEPAIEQAFRGIDDLERLERGVFFDDLTQVQAAKAPQPRPGRRPTSGGDLTGLKDKVKFLRKRAKADPGLQPNLAAALVELAWATFDARTPSMRSPGLRPMAEAVTMYERFAAQEPLYRPVHVDTLIQQSAIAAQLGQSETGFAAAAEAVALANAHPDVVEPPLLAKAQANLASIYHEAGETERAAEPIRKATENFDAFIAKEHYAHADLLTKERYAHPDVLKQAGAAHNLRVIVDTIVGDTQSAFHSADVAAFIYGELSEREPGDREARAGFGRSRNNLANLHLQSGNFDAAIAAAEKASDIFGELAAEEPQNYLQGYATAAQTFSAALAQAGQADRALAAAEHAVHLWRDLIEVFTGRKDLAGLIAALNNLSARYRDVGDYAEARRVGEEAITYGDDPLVQLEPPPNGQTAVSAALAPVWGNLAMTYRQLGEPRLAADAAEHASTLYSTLGVASSNPHAQALLTIAEANVEMGQMDQAYVAARVAADFASAAGFPYWEAAALRLAAQSVTEADPAAAVSAAERSVNLYTALGDATGSALAYEVLAVAHDAQGDGAVARTSREIAVKLRRQALDSDPIAESRIVT
jgi:tetratricopeptide (TPR) repeat protein